MFSMRWRSSTLEEIVWFPTKDFPRNHEKHLYDLMFFLLAGFFFFLNFKNQKCQGGSMSMKLKIFRESCQHLHDLTSSGNIFLWKWSIHSKCHLFWLVFFRYRIGWFFIWFYILVKQRFLMFSFTYLFIDKPLN